MVTFIIIVFPVLSTLASHGTFRRDAKDDARKKPEQIRCIGFSRVMETKRELYADNGFEEDEVGIGHSRKTWLGLEIENV